MQAQEYERKRGEIIVDGQAVAQSTETKDVLKFQRSYPFGPTYAHIVGYRPVNLAAVDVERLQNEWLSGTADTFAADRLLEMFTGKAIPGRQRRAERAQAGPGGGLQGVAEQHDVQQGGRRGGTRPEHRRNPGHGVHAELRPEPAGQPRLRHRAEGVREAGARTRPSRCSTGPLSETFPPGSTFKVVVAAGGAAERREPGHGADRRNELHRRRTPARRSATLPAWCARIRSPCANALRVSCNTAFARYGVEQLGADKLKQAAQAFGFEIGAGDRAGPEQRHAGDRQPHRRHAGTRTARWTGRRWPSPASVSVRCG